MNKRKTGGEAEAKAVRFLCDNGVKILKRNFYTRGGEVDIIGLHDGYVVFFEVKFRTDDRCGDPAEAVDSYKKRHIVYAAKYYLYKKHYPVETHVRFDVIAITGDNYNWIKNAFECC